MAAAEYFQQGLPPSAQHMQTPRPQQPNSSLPYPISDEPPPYSSIANSIRPHSQPPPHQRAAQPGYNAHGPPMNGQYPPDKGSNLQNMYHPGDFGGQQQNFIPGVYPTQHPQVHFTPPPQQPGLYPPPAMQSVYGNNDGRRPSSNPGYYTGPSQPPPFQRRASSRSRSSERSHSQDRDRDRSRHRHHHHHHHHNNNGQSGRPTNGSRKKSNGVATFLGAGGGAIIGDAIFPGLGTIGGAILGGVGGHEYGKQKRSYSGAYGKSFRPRSYSNAEDGYYDERRGRR